jgi:hypothetical protein
MHSIATPSQISTTIWPIHSRENTSSPNQHNNQLSKTVHPSPIQKLMSHYKMKWVQGWAVWIRLVQLWCVDTLRDDDMTSFTHTNHLYIAKILPYESIIFLPYDVGKRPKTMEGNRIIHWIATPSQISKQIWPIYSRENHRSPQHAL